MRKREGDRWAEYFAERHKRTESLSRRRKADHIYSKADRPSAAVLAAHKPHSFPSTLQTTNRRYPSTPRTSGTRLGAPSSHWSLVSSYLMQQDHHCAPRKSPHRVEDISYYGRGLQAETAITHRLHGVFHDAQRRARSVSQALVGAVLDVLFCETARLSSSRVPCPLDLVHRHERRRMPRKTLDSALTAQIFRFPSLLILRVEAAGTTEFMSNRLPVQLAPSMNVRQNRS